MVDVGRPLRLAVAFWRGAQSDGVAGLLVTTPAGKGVGWKWLVPRGSSRVYVFPVGTLLACCPRCGDLWGPGDGTIKPFRVALGGKFKCRVCKARVVPERFRFPEAANRERAWRE